jgi:hypothetical protein
MYTTHTEIIIDLERLHLRTLCTIGELSEETHSLHLSSQSVRKISTYIDNLDMQPDPTLIER